MNSHSRSEVSQKVVPDTRMYDRVEVIYGVDAEEPVEIHTIDVDDVPRKVRTASSIVRDLDGKRIKQVVIPVPWATTMIQLQDKPPVITRLRVDETGRTYINLVPKLRPDLVVKVYFDHKEFYEIMLEIDGVIDFCDNCGLPLGGQTMHEGYTHMDGGGLEIFTYSCAYCETPSIRFTEDWLKWHPLLKTALERYAPTLIKEYAGKHAVKPGSYRRRVTSPQQRLGRHG